MNNSLQTLSKECDVVSGTWVMWCMTYTRLVWELSG